MSLKDCLWISLLRSTWNDSWTRIPWLQGWCVELWRNTLCNDLWILAIWRPWHIFTLQENSQGWVRAAKQRFKGWRWLNIKDSWHRTWHSIHSNINQVASMVQTIPTSVSEWGANNWKNSIPADPKILEIIEQFGFKSDYAEKCINNNKHN